MMIPRTREQLWRTPDGLLRGGGADLLALALMLAFVLLGFLLAVCAVVTTELMEVFSFSSAKIGLLSTIFTVACCCAGIPAYSAAARWGGRMLVIGVALAVGGAVVFALSSSFAGFLGGRFLQGAGAGWAVAVSAALLAGNIVPRLHDRALGISIMGAGLGFILALAVMPAIQGAHGYRTVFLATAGIVFVLGAGPLSHPVVREIRSGGSGGGISLRATSKGLADVARQVRMWPMALVHAAATAVAASLVLWMPIFLQDQKGAPLAFAADLSAWLGVAYLLGAPVGALAASRVDRRPLLAVWLVVMTAATALVPLPGTTAGAFVFFVLAMFFSAMTIRYVWWTVSRLARRGLVSPAKGFIGLASLIGAAIAPWLYGVVLDLYGAAPREHGYKVAHVILAGFAFVGLLCAIAYASFTRARAS